MQGVVSTLRARSTVSSSRPCVSGRRITQVSAMAASSSDPFVVVGGGRVGLALKDMGAGTDVLVKRNEKVPADGKGPIIVCTR
jgi:hypothetical protein